MVLMQVGIFFYHTFHEKDTGDYLSMMTNDVKQMTALGWDSFYAIVSITFQHDWFGCAELVFTGRNACDECHHHDNFESSF